MRDKLVRLAYRFLWNLDDAEDAVQDALATAHERTADLREQDKWWGWVCRIVVQRCHLQGRSKGRQQSHHDPYEQETRRRRSQPATAPSPGEKDAVVHALGDLPRRQREVVVLRHLQGMAYSRIAEVLGISPSTARVHAQKGREALRDLLLARDPEFFEDDVRRGGAP